jgi:hypothetical protein
MRDVQNFGESGHSSNKCIALILYLQMELLLKMFTLNLPETAKTI